MAKEEIILNVTEVFLKKDIWCPSRGYSVPRGTIGFIHKIETTREGFWFCPYHDGGPFICIKRNDFKTKKQSDASLKRFMKKFIKGKK